MSDQEAFSDLYDLGEKALVEKMKNRTHTGLPERIAGKEEASKEAVAKLFLKMHAGEISEAPVTNPSSVKRLEETAPFTKSSEPIVVTQQLNRAVPTSLVPVNKENEPEYISWRPTTVQIGSAS